MKKSLFNILKKLNIKDTIFCCENVVRNSIKYHPIMLVEMLKISFITEDKANEIKNDEIDAETQIDSNNENLQDILESANQLGMAISLNDVNEWIHFEDNEHIFQNLSDAQFISAIEEENKYVAQKER